MNALIDLFKYNFDILAFPCNQFGLQEPGENDEILNGIKYVRPGSGYEPKFEIAVKIDVNGPGEHPLYTYLKVRCFFFAFHHIACQAVIAIAPPTVVTSHVF